jgi:hypothetical protein
MLKSLAKLKNIWKVLTNNWVIHNGTLAPIRDRISVLAAIAEAATLE